MAQHAELRSAEAGNPLHHTRMMSERFGALIEHLRNDVGAVDEPQFKAMFETAAEVLEGLRTAFHHYEEKGESAWKRQ